ncbi:putative Protein HVA22 [Hibiscus syriacus]|uniref:Uncharacterized protein n=1 Tax=Hibiscus syriacus TaxID=106335 RepID=A0A6A2YL51_HIBSY|nr:putative Protein HVA22 [Hibiscus syriacus]
MSLSSSSSENPGSSVRKNILREVTFTTNILNGVGAGSNEDKGMDCEEEVIRCEFESKSAEEGRCENIAEEDGGEIVEDEQVVELPAEELNKRVEEFIARVNKQRWKEAQLMVC